MRETHRCLDRAVAAAYDEDMGVRVRLRFDQTVHHFGEFFSGHPELARRAAAAECQDHGPGAIASLGGFDGERAVRFPADALDLFLGVDRQAGTAVQLLPELDDLLLGHLQLVEFPVQREFDGTRHDDLLARILGHGAAELVLLERHVAEFPLDRAQRRADPRRTGAHDADVDHARPRAPALDGKQPAADEVDAIAPFVDGILDQREPAELARDEEIGDVRFMFRRKLRHVGAHTRTCHDDGDRADGACLGAEAMADAFVAVDDRCLAGEHRQDIAFGAHLDARPTPDAVRRVDVRMLRAGAIRVQIAPLGRGARRGLLAIGAAHVSYNGKEQEQPESDVDHGGEHRILHL